MDGFALVAAIVDFPNAIETGWRHPRQEGVCLSAMPATPIAKESPKAEIAIMFVKMAVRRSTSSIID